MADRIVSRLFGGAGNRLFQYAAGRALADKLGCTLELDMRYSEGNVDRGNCFAHFQNARFEIATDLPPAKSDGLLRYSLWRAFGQNPRFVRERGLGFNSGFFSQRPNIYLHGYWQSQNYFGSDIAQLRRDLVFTTALDQSNADMAARISDANVSVAVHVRRGDYLASGSFAACTPEYYRTAVSALHSRLDSDLTCFVFSNDPGWTRDNLDLGQETVIVDINDEKTGHFDMHLQSLCAHNVIANSTFSWWGAWLNPNPDKIVVAPKNWFNDPKLSNPDLIPDGWTRL